MLQRERERDSDMDERWCVNHHLQACEHLFSFVFPNPACWRVFAFVRLVPVGTNAQEKSDEFIEDIAGGLTEDERRRLSGPYPPRPCRHTLLLPWVLWFFSCLRTIATSMLLVVRREKKSPGHPLSTCGPRWLLLRKKPCERRGGRGVQKCLGNLLPHAVGNSTVPELKAVRGTRDGSCALAS